MIWLSRVTLEGKDIAGLDCQQHLIPSSDDSWKIRIRIYRPQGTAEKLPALIYIHGGGYLVGSPETAHGLIEEFIARRPCVVIAPDYRKAHTEPFPAGFNDCYDTLLWAKANADDLGIRGDRFIVAGHSAGGGLTAAITHKVRDTGDVDMAFQMPIYPMIDDQQPNDPERSVESPVWDTELNRIAWSAYLSSLHERGEQVPAYAAPARNSDYSGFPPTISFVGNMEPFYREAVDYIEALRTAGVEVAFKVYEGCFHAFDLLDDGVGADASAYAFDQYAHFYDRFCKDKVRHQATAVDDGDRQSPNRGGD